MSGLVTPLMMKQTAGVFCTKVPTMDSTFTPSESEPLLQLLEELRTARNSSLRQSRRLRLLSLILGLMAALTGWFAYQARSSAQTPPLAPTPPLAQTLPLAQSQPLAQAQLPPQAQTQPQSPSLSPFSSAAQPQPDAQELARQRAHLLAQLPEGSRRELEQFAREAEWLGQYLRTLGPDEAGALVALMLFRMAKTMENMDAMEQHMRTMSTQMAALPAIVAELNQINGKMSVITHDMDSTMGRAGRMMPWMPFGP